MKRPEITPWNMVHVYMAGIIWVYMLELWIVVNVWFWVGVR